MEQRILPSVKQSHVPELDELSNHCQKPPSSTFVSLAQRTESCCSSVSSLKLSVSWHLLINSPPSPHLRLLCYCHSVVTITILNLARG